MDITARGFEKASAKLTADQLDKPIDEVVVEASTESVPETPVEAPKPDPEVSPEKEEQQEPEEEKVPKSRFLTMHQRAVEAEKRLRQLEAEAKERPTVEETIPDDETLKKHYVDIFGEGELTDKLYKAELARLQSIEEKAAERAFERLSQREQQEQALIQERVDSFDSAFEELAIAEGKTEFNDDEQVAILDIVEKYSPKDGKGKLLKDYLMPLDQAYEIYKLQSEVTAKPKKQERNSVAALQGARSEGTPAASNDAEWRPGQQRRWWDKVK